ncbi:hypothetical protein LUQ84_000513 [Hamiltosporidium tvaerminnensis]|nr:hypothetical protein LUQ84_000513 [Hamiltosporidium tvaerminnensis]
MEIQVKIKEIKSDLITTKCKRKFVFQDKSNEIENNFTIKLLTLHDQLFSSLEVIFYEEGLINANVIGTVIIMVSSIFKGINKYKILHGCYAYDYISYEEVCEKGIGEICFDINIEAIDNSDDKPTETHPLFMGMLYKMFGSSDYFNRIVAIKNILLSAIKGSVSCRFNFLRGLIPLEKYYTFEYENILTRFEPGSVLETRSLSQDTGMEKENGHSKILLHQNGSVSTDCSYKNYEKTNIHEDFVSETGDAVPLLDQDAGLLQKLGHEDINLGYGTMPRDFIIKYRKNFYFSVASYGQAFLILKFIKKQIKVDPEVKEPTKTILEYLNIPEELLLRINLNHSVPHLIFIDSDENNLVISFKGTTDSMDALNDLNCEYSNFYEGYSHKGIKDLALCFIKDWKDFIIRIIKIYDLKGLKITGHSLGGGIAIIVGIILYKENVLTENEIEIIAYSPPPVISSNLCEILSNLNVTCFIYGDDIVSRISYGSFLDLKYLTCSVGSKGYFLFNKNVSEYIKMIKEYLKISNLHQKLYLPGNIFHFRKFNVPKSKFFLFGLFKPSNIKEPIFIKKVDKSFSEEIIISRFCFLHHFFTYLLQSFDYFLENEGDGNLCMAYKDIKEN